MIPVWLIALAKNKWTWVVVGAVAAVSVTTLAVHNYGVSRYNAGVMAERAAWNTIMVEAVEERSRLRRKYDADRARWEAEASALRGRLNQSLTQVREQIANAETVEDIYAAYRAHDDSVRHAASERLARARADYLSSLGVGNHQPTPNNGREPPVADVNRGSPRSNKPGSLVVDDFGQCRTGPSRHIEPLSGYQQCSF